MLKACTGVHYTEGFQGFIVIAYAVCTGFPGSTYGKENHMEKAFAIQGKLSFNCGQQGSL